MAHTRKRRRLNRLAFATAVAPLILSHYLACYCASSWLFGKRIISSETIGSLDDSVFAPMAWYTSTDYSGAYELEGLTYWCEMQGRGNAMTWHDFWTTWLQSEGRFFK
jgi:hypothetical protein